MTVTTTDSWLKASWMQTYTGKQFYPTAPRIEDICIEDIAHALSMTCRYGGHVSTFYSVAEHCYLMSRAVSEENALWALLHDATEAYVGDMVRPLKVQMPEYQAVEDRLMAMIAEKFDLPGVQPPAEVKQADNRILLNERNVLMRTPPQDWEQDGLEPLPVDVFALEPSYAEIWYMDRFYELTAAR